MILLLFGVMLGGLLKYSLRTDEAVNIWLIEDSLRSPDGVRETLRFVRDSLVNTLNRANEDKSLPIYPILLDAWSLATGDSVFSLRLSSTLLMMLALSAIYAIFRDLVSWSMGIIVLILSGTSGFLLSSTLSGLV